MKSWITRGLFNIPGWRTSRHLIVIESDDWGSVRMPSVETYQYLLDNGVRLGKYGYEKTDTIASREDLRRLFEVCEKHRDIKGNPVIITANCVVANPDFEKIVQSGYEQYFYEPVTETMERYYPGESPFSLWKEGMLRGCFMPQFHGREHVNVPLWMKSLKADVAGARLACEKGVFSILVNRAFDAREKNTASFQYINDDEKNVVLESIADGLSLFEHLFGFKSESFIAPSYKWDAAVEAITAQRGVKYIQGVHTHFDNGKKTYTYIGRKNQYGQLYLNRNANFEYSQNQDFDWVGDCMCRIATAYRWHKPATISVHRLNFVGALNPENRDKNLILFDDLLTRIQKKWPDVEFVSTSELGNIITQDKR